MATDSARPTLLDCDILGCKGPGVDATGQAQASEGWLRFCFFRSAFGAHCLSAQSWTVTSWVWVGRLRDATRQVQATWVWLRFLNRVFPCFTLLFCGIQGCKNESGTRDPLAWDKPSLPSDCLLDSLLKFSQPTLCPCCCRSPSRAEP